MMTTITKTIGLIPIAALLIFPIAASADPYKGGPAGRYQRPAMAARTHFAKGTVARARTIGISRDGKEALVVAQTKKGDIWHLTVNRATGRVDTALDGHIPHYGTQDARFHLLNRLGPKSFIYAGKIMDVKGNRVQREIRVWPGDATGRGLPKLTRSHKHLRVGVTGDSEPHNLLVSTRKVFVGNWDFLKSPVRPDPAK
jgi:hypothetical protein